MFTKNQVYLVKELQHHIKDDKKELTDKFKFKDSKDSMRIDLMIKQDDAGKRDFQYLTDQ